MSDVIRRNHYDVTDRVFVADPRAVCAEICGILSSRQRNTRLAVVEQAFEVFSRLYAGALPGYVGCETWYHDAQHSLDCALVMARLLDGYERSAGPADSLRDGREIYLCWYLGEERINYWHYLHTGFAGRQPF